MTENYDLSWHLHNEETIRAIAELRARECLVDTSLYCDNQLFRVHSLVLAACSAYFERILVSLNEAGSTGPGKETVIVLPKMNLALFRSAIDFMYSGKVTVRSDDLVEFMDVAELLEIRGLRSKKPFPGTSILTRSTEMDEEEEERATITVSEPACTAVIEEGIDDEVVTVAAIGVGTEPPAPEELLAMAAITPRTEVKRRSVVLIAEDVDKDGEIHQELRAAKIPRRDGRQRTSARIAKTFTNSPASNAEITSSGYRDEAELKDDLLEIDATDLDDEDDVTMISNGTMDDNVGADQIPQNIPPILAGAEHIERVGFSIWRGQSQAQTGRRLTYFCSMCDYVSEQKCNAMRHEIKHSQIRPYECNICGKAYTENRGLKRHRLSAHPEAGDEGQMVAIRALVGKMNMEDYNLTWKQHSEEAFKAFIDLRAGSNYVDLILFCGSDTFKAHRIILAACSSYFERLFNAAQNEHSRYTVIALTRVEPHLMRLALDFMYSGKVTVPSDQLEAFMSLAELLEIRGLRSKQEEVPQYITRGSRGPMRGMRMRGRMMMRRPVGEFGPRRPSLGPMLGGFRPPRSRGSPMRMGPPPPKMMKPTSSTANMGPPPPAYREPPSAELEEPMPSTSHAGVIVKKEAVDEAALEEENHEADYYEEEENDFKGYGTSGDENAAAEESDEYGTEADGDDEPLSVPPAVSKDAHVTRVGLLTWRGYSQQGQVLYFCEQCGYNAIRKSDCIRHEATHMPRTAADFHVSGGVDGASNVGPRPSMSHGSQSHQASSYPSFGSQPSSGQSGMDE